MTFTGKKIAKTGNCIVPGPNPEKNVRRTVRNTDIQITISSMYRYLLQNSISGKRFGRLIPFKPHRV